MSGPLHGLRVVEMGGLGPAPFAGMLLADLGAEVVRVDRPVRQPPADAAANPASIDPTTDLLNRGRRMLVVDVKARAGRELLHDLVLSADVLIEGFRPGVMERLGLGPEELLAINPRLVFGRMTGWGQDGPLSQAAGHDINYIALAGVLAHIGTADDPIPPLNLVGDFGGGGMLLAFGVLAALFERQASGLGQVVDAAMVDGAAVMMASYWGMLAAGTFDPARRQANVLDGGAPFYGVYRCRDGRHISIASAEPQFWAELVDRLGVDLGVDPVSRLDRTTWPELRRRLEAVFAERTQAEWCELLEGTDVCFAPVLTMDEAATHRHNVARQAFIDVAGVRQPATAPRFGRTAPSTPTPPERPGHHSRAVLAALGRSDAEIDDLIAAAVVVEG